MYISAYIFLYVRQEPKDSGHETKDYAFMFASATDIFFSLLTHCIFTSLQEPTPSETCPLQSFRSALIITLMSVSNGSKDSELFSI